MRYAPKIAVKYSGKTYDSRKRILRRLGFKTYQQYLDSKLWRWIRARVYAAKGTACTLCTQPATELHHNRYHRNDLLGRNLAHIHPLCRQCHESIEFTDQQKATLAEAALAFEARVAAAS